MTLPPVMYQDVVRAALLEDLGRAGDITTEATVPATTTGEVALIARDRGCVSGVEVAALAWQLLDARVELVDAVPEGTQVAPGQLIALVHGPARALLSGERVALNFLSHLSGIATATSELVDAVAGTDTRICCTRKTTPGLRVLEKQAVRHGGGASHRSGLDDAILIKDNHIAFAGSIQAAVAAARAAARNMAKIEVEVDTLDQLAQLLADPVDVVLLDNMTPQQLRAAVAMVDGRMLTEASGRITGHTARMIAECGVDIISSGAITHSAPICDIGLDYRSHTP